MSGEIASILASPETRDRMIGLGLEIAYMPSADFAVHVKAELAKWTRLLKEAGLQGRQGS